MLKLANNCWLQCNTLNKLRHISQFWNKLLIKFKICCVFDISKAESQTIGSSVYKFKITLPGENELYDQFNKH